MEVNEDKKVNQKYRIFDEAKNIWHRISFWTKASDVECEDGETAEKKLSDVQDSLAVNMCSSIMETTEKNGVTCTYNDGSEADKPKGSYTLNGTATADCEFNITGMNAISNRTGDFVVSTGTTGASLTGYNLYVANRTNNCSVCHCFDDPTQIKLDNTKSYDIWIMVYKNTTVTNVTVKPMLEKGLVAHEYVPYIDNEKTIGKTVSNLSNLILSHIKNTANPHQVTKAQVGLSNVDNTPDNAKTVRRLGTFDSNGAYVGNNNLWAMNNGFGDGRVKLGTDNAETRTDFSTTTNNIEVVNSDGSDTKKRAFLINGGYGDTTAKLHIDGQSVRTDYASIAFADSSGLDIPTNYLHFKGAVTGANAIYGAGDSGIYTILGNEEGLPLTGYPGYMIVLNFTGFYILRVMVLINGWIYAMSQDSAGKVLSGGWISTNHS